MTKHERNLEVVQQLKTGMTLEEVGEIHGISRERVRQIFRKYEPNASSREYGRGLRITQRLADRQNEIRKKYNRDTWYKQSAEEYDYARYFITKKNNSKKTKHKWEFSIQMSDVVWPTHCPILGIELDWSGDMRKENSPSMDRIDNTKGYIPGNVEILSWRANRIKNDGTAEEHRLIYEHLIRKTQH